MTTDLSGTVLDDRYRLSSLLGVGGMGQVYEGTHISLDRRVAIKVLPGDLSKDLRFRARFAREARAAAKVTHRNVVQIMDFGGSPDSPVYFVMEFLDGRDLGALLRDTGRLAWPRARRLLLQAVSALKAAHFHGIIHRDIKPGNCFLIDLPHEGLVDVVKLLDFGIAKVLSEIESQSGTLVKPLTATGEIMGTASYMAPEQARCEQMDARSDVYSLGIMAYEMLTGRVPFVGVNAFHVVTRHLHDRPDPLRRAVPDIIPDVEDIVLRAIAKDPEDRFQSMAELETAILAVVDESTDSAQTRVFSSTGAVVALDGGQRGSPGAKPDNPTIVLREVDVEPLASGESFDEAETPSPLLLRHKFGAPYPLSALPKDEPSEPASERANELVSKDRAEITESQRTTRVRIATPPPRNDSGPVLGIEPAEPVVAGGRIVVDVSGVEDTSASLVVPTLDVIDAPVAVTSGIVADEDAVRSTGTHSRRNGWTSWPRLLGIVGLLGGGGAIAAMSMPEAREGRAFAVAASIEGRETTEQAPPPVEAEASNKSSLDTSRPTAHAAEVTRGPALVGSSGQAQTNGAIGSSIAKPQTKSVRGTEAPEDDELRAAARSKEPAAPVRPATRPPKPKIYDTGDCEYRREQAHRSDNVRDYAEVIKLAARGPCWPSSRRIERVRLYQNAMSNTKRYAECVSAGAGIEDPVIATATEYCRSKQGASK